MGNLDLKLYEVVRKETQVKESFSAEEPVERLGSKEVKRTLVVSLVSAVLSILLTATVSFVLEQQVDESLDRTYLGGLEEIEAAAILEDYQYQFSFDWKDILLFFHLQTPTVEVSFLTEDGGVMAGVVFHLGILPILLIPFVSTFITMLLCRRWIIPKRTALSLFIFSTGSIYAMLIAVIAGISGLTSEDPDGFLKVTQTYSILKVFSTTLLFGMLFFYICSAFLIKMNSNEVQYNMIGSVLKLLGSLYVVSFILLLFATYLTPEHLRGDIHESLGGQGGVLFNGLASFYIMFLLLLGSLSVSGIKGLDGGNIQYSILDGLKVMGDSSDMAVFESFFAPFVTNPFGQAILYGVLLVPFYFLFRIGYRFTKRTKILNIWDPLIFSLLLAFILGFLASVSTLGISGTSHSAEGLSFMETLLKIDAISLVINSFAFSMLAVSLGSTVYIWRHQKKEG